MMTISGDSADASVNKGEYKISETCVTGMSPLSVAILLKACLWLAYAASLNEEIATIVPEADVNYRLPLNIKPINYKIHLKPFINENGPKRFTFDGECFIEIQALQNTSEIQLHIKNLDISLCEYYKKDSAVKTALPKLAPNNLSDIVAYNLNEELQANVSYILHYVYVGSINEEKHGFYRSNYTTSKNVSKWLGGTQFETKYARHVFPSFDEPKFKATFDLSLTHHQSLRSTGPTSLIGIKHDGEYITDIYDTTPKMSTYILAFILSEFNDRSDGRFGVLARPEYYSQTEYSFDIGRKLLKAFDDYFGIPYYSMGNSKMHLAAIPDFTHGAMENWGLLTFREPVILYDKEHSTLSSKQEIAAIVAHEQAHMWFGNLVTCNWWSYTWLNEGFASYFEYFGTDLVEPSFDMTSQFVVHKIQYVMVIDATNATNPMSEEDTNTPADLSTFNSISYIKGATFIRMTKYILGEEKFRISLNEYLTTHAYTNTIPSDLLTIWKKYWPAEYAQYAESYFYSFTTQVGYPVVTFNRTSKTTVEVSQKRFLLMDFDTADPNITYTVPITYTTSSERDFQNAYPKFFLQQNSTIIPVSKDASWVIGNIRETGYYRVNYDTESWKQIHLNLYSDNWGGIHELSRAQIVDDLLNLACAGEVDYIVALNGLKYLKTETNYLPWAAAFNGFRYLAVRLGIETHDFARYIRYISNKAYIKLGFEEKKDDTALDIYNRANILAWSCKFGNTECIAKAKSYFNADLKVNPVPVNIRSVVYCTAMREGNEADFNKLYSKYKTEIAATEKYLILVSLGCVKDRKLISRFFHIVISSEVRRQHKFNALSSLCTKNYENLDSVFALIEKHFEELAQAMGGYSSVASVVSNIAACFTTELQLENLKTFNNKHKDKFGKSIFLLQTAVKDAELSLDWSKEKLGPVKSYFQQHDSSSNSIYIISVLLIGATVLIALKYQKMITKNLRMLKSRRA